MQIFLTYINQVLDTTFKQSPYRKRVSINVNADESLSFIYCGQKPFGFKPMKDAYSFIVKNDYFENLDLSSLNFKYEIANLKSLPDFTRILIEPNLENFKALINYIFKFSEEYVDKHYIPEYTYDCCHRFMECSDKKMCTNPDILHAKGCNYNNKNLSKGIIFYGKNRNI